MYKEEIITDKARAIAIINWKPEFLFYRNNDGFALNANKEKIDSLWGIVDFFTCSHSNPRRLTPINVRLLVGANAYACIEESGRKTDILLSAGKSAQASLREYAAEQRERAARSIALADLADRAADTLDAGK